MIMTPRETLRRISELHPPRHLFILPKWADPSTLDRLIERGYLTFNHLQRTKGAINLVMGLQLTEKGTRWLASEVDWQNLALKGSIAGASLTAISVAILYLA